MSPATAWSSTAAGAGWAPAVVVLGAVLVLPPRVGLARLRGREPGGRQLVAAVRGRLGLVRGRSGRPQADAADLAAVVAVLAAELEAGADPARAFAEAAAGAPPGRVRAALEPTLGAVALGVPLGAALAAAAAGRDAVVLRPLAASAHVAEATGAPLLAVLDGLAEGLRAQLRLQREVAVGLAGPRATVRLLALLPAVGLLLGTSIGARPVAVLVGGPAGWGCLAVGLGLEAAGLGWVARMARDAERG